MLCLCAVLQAVAGCVATQTFSHILGLDMGTHTGLNPAILTAAIERGQQQLELCNTQWDNGSAASASHSLSAH